MEFNLTFWIVAWILMGLAFIVATCAILFGAKALDRNNPNPRPPGDD